MMRYAAATEHRRAAGQQIRNTSSPKWRGWLKPENRCFVAANSFAEYAPEPNPETKKKERGVVRAQRPPTAVRLHQHFIGADTNSWQQQGSSPIDNLLTRRKQACGRFNCLP